MPINLIECIAQPDDMRPAPCLYGNIVDGHACYCHNSSPHTPRKCPIWARYGYDPADPEDRKHWHRGECEFFEPTEETR